MSWVRTNRFPTKHHTVRTLARSILWSASLRLCHRVSLLLSVAQSERIFPQIAPPPAHVRASVVARRHTPSAFPLSAYSAPDPGRQEGGQDDRWVPCERSVVAPGWFPSGARVGLPPWAGGVVPPPWAGGAAARPPVTTKSRGEGKNIALIECGFSSIAMFGHKGSAYVHPQILFPVSPSPKQTCTT